MAWFRNNAVAIASALIGAFVAGCGTYAAAITRIAVLEEKVQDIGNVKDNVLILCTHLQAPCINRGE